MSDAAGRHDRARDLPGRARAGGVDDVDAADGVDGVRRRRTDARSPDRAGAPGREAS